MAATYSLALFILAFAEKLSDRFALQEDKQLVQLKNFEKVRMQSDYFLNLPSWKKGRIMKRFWKQFDLKEESFDGLERLGDLDLENNNDTDIEDDYRCRSYYCFSLLLPPD
jgi:hypothetical protein